VFLLFGISFRGRLVPRWGGPDPSPDQFGRCGAFTHVVFCASITVRDQFLRWPAHAYGSLGARWQSSSCRSVPHRNGQYERDWRGFQLAHMPV